MAAEDQPYGFFSPATLSRVLIGLSLLGNLDVIYKHDTFRAIELHSVTNGDRQRSGGILMFGYTFAGRLYDRNGFEAKVIDKFWEGVIEEFLAPDNPISVVPPSS